MFSGGASAPLDSMRQLRGALEWWNESGLVVTGLMCVGYFGSRGMLGKFPLLIAVCLCLASAVTSYLLARQQPQQEADSWDFDRPKNQTLDRFILFFLAFLSGIILFAFLGAIV
jgi:hypothetical protein